MDSRLVRLQKHLSREEIDLLVVEETTNLYYLTGCDLSLGTLLVWPDSVALLVDGRYATACRQSLSWPIYPYEDAQFKELIGKAPVTAVGIDADATTFSRYRKLEGYLASHQRLVALNSPLNALRMIKEESELTLLREAAELGSVGYDYALSVLKPGCREIEIAAELEIFWKRRGAEGVAFSPIIAFGPNSALPHYRAGERSLAENDCALLDIGVKWRHYHSDMTRVAFIGKPKPQLVEIYKIVADAQEAALALCRPGMRVGEIDNAARSLIAKSGYGDYFNHGLGHGVGLEIHEAPRIRGEEPYCHAELQANMVITIEPGIYLPGEGGIRLENTVIIRENGFEDITKRHLLHPASL